MNICQIFLRHIPGISWVYHRYMLALYEVNLMHILLISWVYIRQILSIYSYLRYILHLVLKKVFGIFNLYLSYLTGIFKAYMRYIISKSQA